MSRMHRFPAVYAVKVSALWAVAWMATQALFIIDVPIITPWLEKVSVTNRFLILTMWIVVVAVVATLMWSRRCRFGFLRARRPLLIAAAYLPVAVLATIVALKPEIFGVPGWLYALAIVVTSPIQDLLTFGYLQTALEERVPGIIAVGITALLFFLGHFHYAADVSVLVFLGASILFAGLRLRTGTLYAVSWIHLTYLLVTAL